MGLSDAELKDLYRRTAHVVLYRCRALLGDEEEARDAVQEVFAKVLRHGDAFRAEASPVTWMYRIATNHCLNVLRDRKSRQGKLDANREEIGGESRFSSPDRHDDLGRLQALLEGLDDETRAVVVYAWLDEHPKEEIARLVGISVPTVRKRLDQFLAHARRQLGVAAASIPFLIPIVSWSTSWIS